MKIPIIYSTITGNAFRLADAVFGEVPEAIGPYNIRYINDEVINTFDTFVICYWCNRGTADDDTIALISKLHHKKLIVLGTLGAPVDGAHAAKVRERVEQLASADNELLGHFLCRGKIDPARTEHKHNIPEGEKGHLDDAGYQRHLESRVHPTKQDLEDAGKAVQAAVAHMNNEEK